MAGGGERRKRRIQSHLFRLHRSSGRVRTGNSLNRISELHETDFSSSGERREGGEGDLAILGEKISVEGKWNRKCRFIGTQDYFVFPFHWRIYRVSWRFSLREFQQNMIRSVQFKVLAERPALPSAALQATL